MDEWLVVGSWCMSKRVVGFDAAMALAHRWYAATEPAAGVLVIGCEGQVSFVVKT